MANIPLKWGIIDTDGKVEINGADDSAFSSSSPAFKVNGDGTVTGSFSVSGNGTITGDLTISGANGISAVKISTSGSVTADGDLSVSGNGTITGKLTVNGADGISAVKISTSGNVTVGGDLTIGGNATFNSSHYIAYTGTKTTYAMIKFKDNTADTFGNGIVIGGGGLTVIGGGESADTIAAKWTTGGEERLCLCNDGAIDFFVNCQDGASSAVNRQITTAGNFTGGSAYVNDKTNGTATYLDYGAAGVAASDITWLAVWNGYNLRAMNKNQVLLASQATSAATASTVCWRDGSGDTHFRYAYTTHVNQSSSDQTTTLDAGQYMIYCNSDGWLRKAKHLTSLYNGSLKYQAQTTWANVNAYSYYVVIGVLKADNYHFSVIIPKNLLTNGKSDSAMFTYSDNDRWKSFHIWYSGTTGYLYSSGGSDSNAAIQRIIGLN